MGPRSAAKQHQSAISGWTVNRTARFAIAATVFVALMALSWGLGAGPARAAGTRRLPVSVTVSPRLDRRRWRAHDDTLTATVLDSDQRAGVTATRFTFAVPGDPTRFSQRRPCPSAAATGSTRPRSRRRCAPGSTITATDTDASVSSTGTGAAQTLDRRRTSAVSMNPTSIAANGTSTATATATVTDGNGNPVSGDNVAFTRRQRSHRERHDAGHQPRHLQRDDHQLHQPSAPTRSPRPTTPRNRPSATPRP